MKLYDIVEWDEASALADEIIVKKHEAEDFNTHSQLIVHASQEAIFFKDGADLDLFGAGRHTLSTQNIPLLKKIMSIPTGGETPFKAQVYFINKIFMNDLRWGTPSPILMQDPVEGVNIHVRAAGLFGAHIEDSRKLLRKVVGTREQYTKTELGQYLRAKIIERVTDLLGQAMIARKISILNISPFFKELSDDLKAQMIPFFAEYGITIDNFSFNTINVPDQDLDEINKMKIQARRMDMESEALARKRAREGYSYQQERQYDVLGSAASNESPGMGGFMGAGMGLGMGVGMGGAFGQSMNGMVQNAMNQPNQPVQPQGAPVQGGGAVCPSCNSPVAPGAKFCNNCGAKLGGPVCPNCGAEVTPGAKFCNNCGAKLASVCPKCGAEIAPGAKFCPNCGEKI